MNSFSASVSILKTPVNLFAHVVNRWSDVLAVYIFVKKSPLPDIGMFFRRQKKKQFGRQVIFVEYYIWGTLCFYAPTTQGIFQSIKHPASQLSI